MWPVQNLSKLADGPSLHMTWQGLGICFVSFGKSRFLLHGTSWIFNCSSCQSKRAQSCVNVYRHGEGVCIVTQLRESSPVAGTNCVIKQCIRLYWDLTKSSSMEHDVVPLTGCCARGCSSERSEEGQQSERQPRVRVRSQYTFGPPLFKFCCHSPPPQTALSIYRLRVPCAQH